MRKELLDDDLDWLLVPYSQMMNRVNHPPSLFILCRIGIWLK